MILRVLWRAPSGRWWTAPAKERARKSAKEIRLQHFKWCWMDSRRVQSLLLAFGGDGWGIKQCDREWNVDLRGIRQRGPQGQAHWSLGCLCVDLETLTVEYDRAKRMVSVDFQKVLSWVVTDSANGQSNFPKKPHYVNPLSTVASTPGRYIRLSRLWQVAPEQEGLEIEEAEALCKPLLSEHQVKPEQHAMFLRPLGSLLTSLGRVKRTRVTYLELSEYSSAHGTRDDYDDAIVSIFTRLNTAGRTLTEEDITFAWLKIGWNVSATRGASAAKCFDELREGLEDFDLSLTTEELVSAVSFIWAVQFRSGKLLGKQDLLKGEAIRPMASQISENWPLVVEALTTVSAQIRDRRLRFGDHYQSLNAMQFLWAIYFSEAFWRKGRPLNELEKDALEKRLAAMFDELADRWLICSGWAGLWASGTAETMNGLAARLSNCVAGLSDVPHGSTAIHRLQQHLELEVHGLEKGAVEYINTLRAADRKQVRNYYSALWIWNRLEMSRWANAKLALREKRRKPSTLHVDHVVAWGLWRKKLQNQEEVSLEPQAIPNPEEQEQIVNSIGNCLLLEKNFNISKSDKPLNSFLNNVHEFKTGQLAVDNWAAALDLNMAQVDSAATPATDLASLFASRAEKIRSNLVEFVRGSKARIDLEEALMQPIGALPTPH